MAHWFHRNPLKATSPAGFELKQVLTNPATGKICSDLRLTRVQILEMLTDPNRTIAEMEEEFGKYLALFHGFLTAVDEKLGDSKLRPLMKFKWTNSMLGYVPTEVSDAWFEVLSILLNLGLWYSKHAAKISGKDEVKEEEAKEVHQSLRKAAGVFDFVKREKSRLHETTEPGSDLDDSVLNAYIQQCTAEAQEVTVARAIELKHSASLISALSNETSKLFSEANNSLSKLNPAIYERWSKYLQLKAQFYLAYAYAFLGESLLGEDKCGEAVRACRESEKCFSKAEELCKEYAKAKGPSGGKAAKPENHLFFRNLRPILKRSLEKAERENGFIYHQKIPDELPELPTKATYGLVKPDEYAFPPPSPLWTPQTYAAFDINKAPMPDFSKAKKSEKELPAVKEQPVYQTDKDPNNHSGCVVS